MGAKDGHLDSHTATELCQVFTVRSFYADKLHTGGFTEADVSGDRPVELSTLTSQVSAEPKGDKPQITISPVTISEKEDRKAAEKEEEATQGSLDKEEDPEDAQRPTATRLVPGKDGDQGQGQGHGHGEGQCQGQDQGREINLPVLADEEEAKLASDERTASGNPREKRSKARLARQKNSEGSGSEEDRFRCQATREEAEAAAAQMREEGHWEAKVC